MTIYTTNPKEHNLKKKKLYIKKFSEFINSGNYILSNEVKKFENNFAKFIGSKYAIGVASGTDAIVLALKSLSIGYGDEVITTSHTAVATISAIKQCNAKPILVDIEQDYFTMDPEKTLLSVTKKTKAIILVHIYGSSVSFDKFNSISKKFNIPLIEDVSQAHGAKYKNKRLGNIGKIGCFSLYPTKNLGALGDAGVVTTNLKKIRDKILFLREYGWNQNRLIKIKNGQNSRLDEFQASILNIKLKSLDNENKKRNFIANQYNIKLTDNIIKPLEKKFSTHVYHIYCIRVKNRERLINFLKSKKIFLNIHYPIPIHKQPIYRKIKEINKLQNLDKISNEIISLPMYPELSIKKLNFVINSINYYYKNIYEKN